MQFELKSGIIVNTPKIYDAILTIKRYYVFKWRCTYS